MLKTDTRFTIETLIVIARTTSSPTMRESLLEEALDILRGGEDNSDVSGVDSFLSGFRSSRNNRIKNKDLYEQYLIYSRDEGFRVIGKHKFYESVRERGFREANLNGYPLFYMETIPIQD